MNRVNLIYLLAISLLVFSATTTRADTSNNHFASILLSGKKIGNVHYATRHDDEGVLQDLKTRSSLSFLGSELYHHSLHVQEFWKDGELKRLWGIANENDTHYQINLNRKSDGYNGMLNDQPIELPANAFPTAVWHYAITQQTLLFSLPELELLKVKVKESEDSVKIGENKVKAMKYVFSGDWKATIWFDHDQQFLKWKYKVKGRTVTVVLDP